MSDEIFDEEESGDEPQSTAGKKKIGFLPAIVIDILKWTAIVVGAIIFIVVVVILTVNMMGGGQQASTTRLPLQSEYVEEGAELLTWFSQLGDIRGTTADEVRQTFIINAHIGYDTNNEAVLPELIQREIQIKEAIAIYFGSREVSELAGVENRLRVKRELREEINRIMTQNVNEVAFDRYEFIEF